MSPMMLSRHRHGLLVDCLEQRTEPLAESTHFALHGLEATVNGGASPEDLVVIHDFTPARIDNDIGYYVANELLPLLFPMYRSRAAADWNEQAIFEHYVGEIVRSVDGNERRAWHRFYDNTLAMLTDGGSAPPRDFINDFSAIYRQAAALIHGMSSDSTQPRSVLDVATCFGFFPLLLARENTLSNTRIVACDLNSALVNLADGYARHRGLPHVTFTLADILVDDIEHLGFPTPTFDVVTAIHLLEHLEPWQTQRAADNLWKLTGSRLIIAVPLEETPDPRFGHRQIFDRKRLLALGRELGGRCHAFEYHGAWIVIDRSLNQKTTKPTEEKMRYA
jgi:2-polyprenyl-3-methyl-5-hydroxy-6-metoxy-1,4-benzoquinol methylase